MFKSRLSNKIIACTMMSAVMGVNLLSAKEVAGHALPSVVDDQKILKDLPKNIGQMVEGAKAVSSKDLNPQLERKSFKLELENARSEVLNNIYAECTDGVVAISSVYKCGKCDEWHSTGAATGWVIHKKGIMVTNYHVFEGRAVAGFGIMTRDGAFAPVLEILAASKRDDVAIFRVAPRADGKDYHALPLGLDAAVGSNLHIIAHPDSRFFTYTSGKVSRYYLKRSRKGDTPPTIMAVTAEFARGSSGGPVMDSMGNVVGMVASTQSIYYPPKKKSDKQGPFQMVIRNCVPASAVRALIEK